MSDTNNPIPTGVDPDRLGQLEAADQAQLETMAMYLLASEGGPTMADLAEAHALLSLSISFRLAEIHGAIESVLQSR